MGACPPVVEYTREEQRRVAEEVKALPEGSVIVDWLSEYMILRGQLRACQQDIHVLFGPGSAGLQLTGLAR